MKDIKDRTPNQDTINHLERLLEKAKSGEIRTVIDLVGWEDDSWTHGWSIDARNSRRRMIGELTLMHFDMLTNQALDDGDSILSMVLE